MSTLSIFKYGCITVVCYLTNYDLLIFHSKSQSERPWYRANDTEERNNMARKAYQALKTVTLRKPNSAKYHRFSEEVKKLAKKRYPDFDYGEQEVRSSAYRLRVIFFFIKAAFCN